MSPQPPLGAEDRLVRGLMNGQDGTVEVPSYKLHLPAQVNIIYQSDAQTWSS